MPTADNASGPAIDNQGHPAQDPSENVRALAEAGFKRGEDLLNLNMSWLDKYTRQLDRRSDDLRDKDAAHFREMLKTQEAHFSNLMATETKRLNDIRAVDVAAVAEAAKVVAAGQLALANQLTVTNDSTRLANQTLASSISDNLATTIKPIIDGLAEVQKRQYESAGAKTQQVEQGVDRRSDRGGMQWAIGMAVTSAFALLSLLVAAVALYLRSTGK